MDSSVTGNGSGARDSCPNGPVMDIMENTGNPPPEQTGTGDGAGNSSGVSTTNGPESANQEEQPSTSSDAQNATEDSVAGSPVSENRPEQSAMNEIVGNPLGVPESCETDRLLKNDDSQPSETSQPLQAGPPAAEVNERDNKAQPTAVSRSPDNTRDGKWKHLSACHMHVKSCVMIKLYKFVGNKTR